MSKQTAQFPKDFLRDKVAFVAGGSSGINLACAQTYARYGARVAIISRNAERVGQAVDSIVQAGGQARGEPADVRDYDSVQTAMEATVKEFGKLDIVYAGAAGNFLAPLVSLSSKGFKTVMDIDLLGTFNVLRGAYAHLNKGASLLAITAPQAVAPMAYQAHACAAKAGVNMLIKCIALEWGPAGFRVNGISPGPIADTEGLRRLTGDEATAAASKARVPLGDWGVKDDIAAAALYLASPAAAYVTGTILEVEGGTGLGAASSDTLKPWTR